MKKIKHLLLLNNSLHGRKIGSQSILSTLFSAVVLGGVFSLVLFVFSNLIVDFNESGADFYLLVFVLFLVMVVQVIFGILICTKVFFSSTQNKILLKYPISGRDLFLSRWLFALLHEMIFGLILLLPILNLFGIRLNMSTMYFVMIPFVTVLCTLLSFCIATILSFPFVFLKGFLSNKYALLLVIFVVIGAAVFIGYMNFLDAFVDISSNIQFRVNHAAIDAIAGMSGLIFTNIWLTSILYLENVALSSLYFVLIIVACLAIIFLLARFAYFRMMYFEVGNTKGFKSRRTGNRRKPLYRALLSREFKMVFRDINFLFQYFAFIIVSPLLTFLCVRASTGIATFQIGAIANVPVAFFVVSVFCVLANSFAATSLSREGNAFFLTKIYPVRPRDIITSKLLFSGISNITGVLASCIVIFATGLISWDGALFVFFAASIFSLGNIAFAINLEVNSPKFADSYNIIKDDRNASIAILTGLSIAIVISLVLFVLILLYSVLLMVIVALSAVVALATLFLWRMYRKLDTRYNKISVTGGAK